MSCKNCSYIHYIKDVGVVCTEHSCKLLFKNNSKDVKDIIQPEICAKTGLLQIERDSLKKQRDELYELAYNETLPDAVRSQSFLEYTALINKVKVVCNQIQALLQTKTEYSLDGKLISK